MAVLEAIQTTIVKQDTASVTFGTSSNNLPQTYKHLQLRCSIFNGRQASYGWLRLRPFDSGSGDCMHHLVFGSGTSTGFRVDGATSSLNFYYTASYNTDPLLNYTTMIIEIMDYTNTSKDTVFMQQSGTPGMGNSGGFQGGLYYQLNANVLGMVNMNQIGALTYFTLDDADGFVAGTTLSLYGYKEAN